MLRWVIKEGGRERGVERRGGIMKGGRGVL